MCAVVSMSVDNHMDLLVAAIVVQGVMDLKRVFETLNGVLPSSHIPDRFVCVDSIPVNSHGGLETMHYYYTFILFTILGKCNYNSLLGMLQVKIRKDIPKSISSEIIEKSELTTILLCGINTVLAGKSEPVIHTEHSLTELGANSFDIVRIVHLLEQKLTNVITGSRIHTTEWYEPLVVKPIEEVITIIHDSLMTEQTSCVYGRKRDFSQSRIDNLGRDKKVLKVETSMHKEAMMKTHRRGIIAFNNRQVIYM